MKKLRSVLLALCLLIVVACMVAPAVFAADTESVIITDVHVLVDEPQLGQPLPEPTIPEGANYTISSWKWYKQIDHISNTEATECEPYCRYELYMEFTPNGGYNFHNTKTNGMINDTITPNWKNQLHLSDTYVISHVWSFKEVIDQVEISYKMPAAGSATSAFSLDPLNTDRYTERSSRYTFVICDEGMQTYVLEDGRRYETSVILNASDKYEFSKNLVVVVNGQVKSPQSVSWNSCAIRLLLDYDQTVNSVEFPAWPEAVLPGSAGGTADLPVPADAGYTLKSAWIDMRTGKEVAVLEAGDVYTLGYVAIPNSGFHFKEATTYTLGGEPCTPMGSGEYMVIYKSYDLGAKKIDRIDIDLPVLKKGFIPGAATVPTDANYALWELIWAESTTGDISDATQVEVLSYGTSIYALPVLCAAKGYLFAEDVKLYFDGHEVPSVTFYAEGPVLEIAGLYGTLTPPETDGWYQEDHSWVYYQNGEKLTNAWLKDSIGWVYLDQNGLMVKNGWARDSVGWCYMNDQGYMTKAKWIFDGRDWYYIKQTGYMASNAWIKDSRDWCYVGADGKMYINQWAQDSVGWCFLGSDGYMVRNMWASDSAGICRLDGNGYMVKSSWVYDGHGWAYVDDRGYAVVSGWQKDSKGWCFIDNYYIVTDAWVRDSVGICRLGSDGYMLKNQWVNDGYGWAYVDKEGRAVTKQMVKDSKGTCYIDSTGYMVKNKLVTIDGKQYYFDENGYMLRNTTKRIPTLIFHNQPTMYRTYKFDSNGVGTMIL